MEDEKYVVFKREDFDRWALALPDTQYGRMPFSLKDAVVIRTQDVFAAAGLSAYAHNIETYLYMLRPIGQLSFDMDTGVERVLKYFQSVQQEAEDRLEHGECKLPD